MQLLEGLDQALSSVTGLHHPARLYLAPPALLHAPSLNPSPAYTAAYTPRGSVCSCRRTCQQLGPQQLLEGTRLAWPSLPALVPITTSVSASSLRHCMRTAAGCHNQVSICHQLWPSPRPTLAALEVLFSSHYRTPLPHAVLTKDHTVFSTVESNGLS